MTDSNPQTRAERSAYTETSTHADVLVFVDGLRALHDARLHVEDFGSTPEARLLPLLVLSAQGHFTPEAAQASGLPIVLVICGIHAGEVEGKEAGLMLVRDLLADRASDLLDQLILVLVPLFNADGNDRISAENRKLDIERFSGQIGPEGGVGTRVNAAGINLNRDYMRQEALEMRLLQRRVFHRWNPHLCIDCHATNGSIHRFAMTYDIPHVIESGRLEPIDFMREQFMPAVSAAVKRNAGFDSFWYGNFVRDEGGEGKGWITYTHHPRFGGNYRGLSNRLDVLLEAYSYQPFKQRVLVTYAFLLESLRLAAAQGGRIIALLQQCLLPPERIAVRYRLEAEPGREVEVLTREPYTLDGAPISVKVPYFGRFVAEHPVQRPLAYAVPPAIARHLEQHGLSIDCPSAARNMDVEVATLRGVVSSAGREILESNASSWLDAVYQRSRRDLPEGWSLVRTEQQRGAIAVYLCEAGSDDGLLACDLLTDTQAGSEFPAWRVLELPTMA